jgi:hypothetical protein
MRTCLDTDITREFTATALRVAKRPRSVLAWIEPSVQAGDLIDAMGDRALVRFWVRDGDLIACTVMHSRVKVHNLGSAADIAPAVQALRFALLLQIRTGRASPRAVNSLAARFIRPLGIGDRPVVVVPVEEMSGLVWAAVCGDRPVSVAPSAGAWLRAREATPGHGTVSIAGPNLTHARKEVTILGHDIQLHGRRSTVDATLKAIDGADIAHIAAHGTFRQDAPMYSYLQLADGPLHGYDLTRLKRAPRLLVLSACEVARAEMFAKAVLDRGGQALIASTLPVPDEQAVNLVTDFHNGMRTGKPPAQALSEAQTRHGHLGFGCIGAG